MKVLTTEQIREADQYTITHEPIRSADLMERAANALMAWLLTRFHGAHPFRIYAGFGNNGGDGIAIARLLAENGRRVYLHVLFSAKGYSADAQENLNRLDRNALWEFSYLKTADDLPPSAQDEIIIDALFGSGLTREPDELAASVIDHINSQPAKVVAVDIPSGLFGEDNRTNTLRHAVKAHMTLTLQVPKLCMFFPEYQRFTGEWYVVPIGLHPDFFSQVPAGLHYISGADCKSWVHVRNKYDHKGTFGHCLIIAGSKGKAGAAVLSARAALRTGCGLATLMVPDQCLPVVQTAVPEAMGIADHHPEIWTTVPDMAPFSATGIGPGLGTAPETAMAFEKLIAVADKPMVLDADALNLISRNPGLMTRLPKNCILTPHPGEFRRLFGNQPDHFSMFEKLKEVSATFGQVVVLKGAHTMVAGPDGSVWFNTTGNPGMATAGSGDVLTGIITSLLAQGYDPFTAARAGVFIHGLAGDIAANIKGQESLVAGDITEHIGQAFIRIKSGTI